MSKKKLAEFWFNPNDTLSYNCLFNSIIGVRGVGKTYNTLKFLTNRYKKHGEKFIYLRRYKTQIKRLKKAGALSDIAKDDAFKDDVLDNKGIDLRINNETMGYLLPLTTATAEKGIPYHEISWILFDEFMVDKQSERYLPNEVSQFLNLFETIARFRDVRVFFIANAFSLANPYFTTLIPDKLGQLKASDKTYNKFDDFLVVMCKNSKYVEEKKKTRFYNLIKNTEFSKHAYDNEFILDKEHFIRKVPPESEHHFNFYYMGKNYGVWVNWNKGEYYVSTKKVPTSQSKTVSLSLEDNRPNNVNIRRVRGMPFMKAFSRAVEENQVFFDKTETWHNLNEVVYLVRTVR